MPFYEAGDGFVTAPKIPEKTSLKLLAKSKMFFTLSFFYNGVQNILRKILNEIYSFSRSGQIIL